MNNYSEFIAKSRYSRFLPDVGRREHWNETVARYCAFIDNHLKEKHDYKMPDALYDEIKNAILNLEVMPSMRAIMTAGKALERDNTAGYNCSYLPIDDPKAFDEAMYILLCGTGVGFSVEQKYVSKLPEIPVELYNSGTVINVKDSKEGWAKALRQVIALLYAGEVPKWEVVKFQILTHCYINRIAVSESDLNCLTLLSFNQPIELAPRSHTSEVHKILL